MSDWSLMRDLLLKFTMDDDILVRCSALKITEDEENVVSVDDIWTDDINPSMELSVFGKVMPRRTYNFEAFKRTMNQIWAISKDALFRSIENGLFVILFATKRDRAKVLEGPPWMFDQNLITMDEINGGLRPSEISLDWSPFWVRLYNLPMTQDRKAIFK